MLAGNLQLIPRHISEGLLVITGAHRGSEQHDSWRARARRWPDFQRLIPAADPSVSGSTPSGSGSGSGSDGREVILECVCI